MNPKLTTAVLQATFTIVGIVAILALNSLSCCGGCQ